jgi:hypothetical protein
MKGRIGLLIWNLTLSSLYTCKYDKRCVGVICVQISMWGCKLLELKIYWKSIQVHVQFKHENLFKDSKDKNKAKVTSYSITNHYQSKFVQLQQFPQVVNSFYVVIWGFTTSHIQKGNLFILWIIFFGSNSFS